ncbi:hypothetical protein N658DRAFT_483081 [Parathielavia hyrcaniae]|uniref:Uncharacterized protein n=1 Tax=Parathielavia hyrcaniae TaxID=113614 RepID=A0AAN6Q8P5_9PEZI|nr:hypothetical protein N658DRAFT_483081 [Parathielavia hyrcaniae]
MKHDTRDLGPLGIFYFLQRIRPEYPDLYDLHVFKVADKAFTWEFLFRDNVRDALLGRFREYPAKLRSKAHENQGKSCKMCRSQLGSGFDPWTRKRYLDGKGLFDFWESAIEGAGEEEE